MVYGHGVSRARVIGKSLLELRYLGPLGKTIGPEYFNHTADVLFIDPLTAIRNKGDGLLVGFGFRISLYMLIHAVHIYF